MRIKAFCFIVDGCAQPHNLKDSDLVIDGQNFLYQCYEKSRLPFKFGAECDQYAAYIKQYLTMFKKANINCYFIFKGGTEYLQNKIIKDQNNTEKCKNKEYNPVFMNDLHLEVLREMGFVYVFTEYEAKTDCIALAKRMSCPVICMDIEYAFAGVQYIPTDTIKPQENIEYINCKMFSLEHFLKKYNLSVSKLAIFILLTDTTLCTENTFSKIFVRNRIPPYPGFKQNQSLLNWLSRNNEETTMKDIMTNSGQTKELILEKLEKAKKLITRTPGGSLAIDYFFNKNSTTHRWFEEGVALNTIAKGYIDIYRSEILLFSSYQFDENAQSPIQISLKIIKYAYDLLTDFQNDGIKFYCNHYDPDSEVLLITDSIKKPTYQANLSVFEKGWDKIKSLGLFQHFMTEEINFKFDKLENVPEDAKLLLVTLVYFHHKKSGDTKNIPYGVILSYIMLNYVNSTLTAKLSASDRDTASRVLKDYFKIGPAEEHQIMNKQLRYRSLEFQLCLKEVNYLNKLCGSPFEPTKYSKTFNGTFVYKFIHKVQNENVDLFVTELLESSPTVLQLFNDMISHYKHLLE